MSETIEELKNAIKAASTQQGEALACTKEWLEGILSDVKSLQRNLANRDKLIAAQTGHIELVNERMESQKQQISAFEAWQPNSWNSHLQIEGYKAITELAVKGLKQISSIRSGGVHWDGDTYYEKFCEVEDTATSTLEEIERLSQ